jgi:tRNA(fMet)-specific endonuclease VapC
MGRYMLDTDTCSYIMKRSNLTVMKRLRAIPVADVCISVITKSELLYGVEVSPRRAQDATALRAFLPYVEVLELPAAAATAYAEIRADLKKRGQMIGANDLFIAAHSRALGLRLVTNNSAEFGRVKDSRSRTGPCLFAALGRETRDSWRRDRNM